MNLWQILRQVKYKLLAQDWTGGSNTVFGTGSVVISAAISQEVKRTLRVPMAIIAPGDAQVDPEHGEEPDVLQQNLVVTLVTAIPGDAVGEKALIGGNVPDRTKSEGRGLLELEEELFSAIEYLGTDLGVVSQHVASGAVRPTLDPDFGYIVYRDYTFRVWCTADRFYHTATRFSATGGAGSVSLSWQLPPDRYDRYKMVLRRASGATAPTSVTSGTGVTLASDLATSVTDTVAAGTYSYALFAQYDESNATPAQADRTSSSVTRTSVVAT